MPEVQERFTITNPRYIASSKYWMIEGYVNHAYRNFILHEKAGHPKLKKEMVLVIDENQQIWLETDLKEQAILEEKEWKKDPMSTIIRGHASFVQLLRLWGTIAAIIGLPILWAWWQVTR